ncbi:hypothetical protein EHJ09_03905 [Cronobacter turicensis]|nr:hypothetical protein [Cronobacter turicensis]
MAAPENKKGVRQCPKTLQDAFILSGLPAAVGEPPGNVCQGLLSKGCARFDGAHRGGCAPRNSPALPHFHAHNARLLCSYSFGVTGQSWATASIASAISTIRLF